jgi:hypothetical protein
MIARLKNFFRRKVQSLKFPLKHIYTDAKGRKWYMFENPNEMPPERMWMAAFFTRYADLCLTRKRLTYLVTKAYDSLNQPSPKIADCAAYLQEMKLAEDLYAEPETLTDLATVYVIGEDEDVWDFSVTMRNRKKEMWKQDPSASAFFLSLVYRLTENFSRHSDINIVTYLEEMKHLTERYKRQ